MVKRINVYVLAALAGFIAQSAQAIVVRGEAWQKKREDGTFHNVICVSDLHFSNFVNSANIKDNIDISKLSNRGTTESQKLMSLLSQVPTSRIKVVLEDWNTSQNGQKILPVFLKELLDKVGVEFLDVFSNECNTNGFDVYNSEVRQKRLGAQNFMEMEYAYRVSLQNLELVKQALDDKNSIELHGEQQMEMYKIEYEKTLANMNLWKNLDVSMTDLMVEFDKAIMEIEAYDDGVQLSSYYSQEINRILESSKIMREKMKLFDGKYSEFLCLFDKTEIIRRFCTGFSVLFGKTLLDLKALHQIYQAFTFENKDIFLVMGSQHINNIVAKLQMLGYEKIEEIGCEAANCCLSLTDHLENLDAIVENEIMPKNEFENELAEWEINKVLPLLCGESVIDSDFFDRHVLKLT